MNVHKGAWLLKNKNCLVERRDIYYGWNRIRSHSNKFESMEHFISKAVIGKLIIKKEDGMISEHEYPDGKVADILQVKKNGDLIAYQVETGNHEELEFQDTDTVYIDLRKMPEDVKESFKKLKNYFKRFIV